MLWVRRRCVTHPPQPAASADCEFTETAPSRTTPRSLSDSNGIRRSKISQHSASAALPRTPDPQLGIVLVQARAAGRRSPGGVQGERADIRTRARGFELLQYVVYGLPEKPPARGLLRVRVGPRSHLRIEHRLSVSIRTVNYDIDFRSSEHCHSW